MKSVTKLVLALALAASPVFAKAPKSYQVTGEVISVDADSITVKKGKENFEIARGKADTQAKTGDRVTVFYTMTADSVEAKAAGGKKK